MCQFLGRHLRKRMCHPRKWLHTIVDLVRLAGLVEVLPWCESVAELALQLDGCLWVVSGALVWDSLAGTHDGRAHERRDPGTPKPLNPKS